LHAVEKWRDPSHNRLHPPRTWRRWCDAAGLETVHLEVQRFQQPDLEWYFNAAATLPENREKVRAAVREASPRVRDVMRLDEAGGKVSWWWHRIVLVARQP
jgi:hypothetical protein